MSPTRTAICGRPPPPPSVPPRTAGQASACHGPGRPPRAGLLPTGGDGSSRASSGPRRLVPGWLRTETARPRLAQDGDGSSGRPQDGNGQDRATTCCAPGFRPWLITSATSSTVVIPYYIV